MGMTEPLSFTLSIKRTGIVSGLTFTTIVLLVLFSWCSDDAFFTFRTVDNFHHGFGLRWNVIERVQTFTHPLWMVVVLTISFFTREYYYTSLALSWLLSCAVVLLLVGHTSFNHGKILLLLLLATSFSFLEFSSSGLENPLTHFLLVVFYISYFSRSPRQIAYTSIAAGLIVLNRMDCILLIAPALIALLYRQRTLRTGLTLLAGMMPFLVWEMFSIVYYGFPFPNTALAKLGAGVSRYDLFIQGLHYIENALIYDPITPLACISACLVTLGQSLKNHRSIALGVILYLLYVILIGGDFMSGRFLSAPFVLSCCILSHVDPARRWMTLIVPVVLFQLLALPSRLQVPIERDFSELNMPSLAGTRHGINIERKYYGSRTGLLMNLREYNFYRTDPYFRYGLNKKQQGESSCVGTTGLAGYAGGPGVYFIDRHALADPFLALQRIPDISKWRIGHFIRAYPEGYIESYAGENKVASDKLAKLLDSVRLITRGPLFSRDRFLEIWKINSQLLFPFLDSDRKS